MIRPKTKILVDGGDPAETEKVKALIGFVDGQTTNPSLIAKNPEIQEMIKSGHKLSKSEEDAEYKKIVSAVSPLVGDAGVSIEVYADMNSTAEQMLAEGRDKFSWIPNAYIKFPCTAEGLKAAHQAVAEGIRCNITLCFSQQQAAAIYAATLGAKEPVYVSPFIGRLDDHGEDGISLIANIKKMYEVGDGHVKILAASVRSIDHLMAIFAMDTDLATVPTKVLEEWAAGGFIMPGADYVYKADLKAIPYEQLDLNKPWDSFNLNHPLTVAGIEKFVADYKSTLNI